MGMNDRLDSLENLEPGWMDGRGYAPSTEAVYSGRTLVKAFEWVQFNDPGIFPLEDGGVVFEFSDFEIEIGDDGLLTIHHDYGRVE